MANYVQTDASATFNVGCSGASDAGATTAARQASIGGSAGASEVSVDTGNNVTRAIMAFLLDKPGISSWTSGTWTVPVNCTAGDAGTTLDAVYVCDFLSGTGYTTVASLTGLSDATTGGIISKDITQGSNHTPQSTADSQPFIVLVFTNGDLHGGSGIGITPNQTITAPFTISTTFQQALNATATGSASLSRTNTFARTLTATVTGAASLSSANIFSKLLSASATGSATLASAAVIGQALAASVTGMSSLSLVPTYAISLNATATATASFVKSIFKTLSAAVVGTASFVRTTFKTLGASAIGSATITPQEVGGEPPAEPGAPWYARGWRKHQQGRWRRNKRLRRR